MKSTTLEQLRKWTFRVSIAVIVFQAIIHLNDMPEALAEGGAFFIGYLIGVAITLAPAILAVIFTSNVHVDEQ